MIVGGAEGAAKAVVKLVVAVTPRALVAVAPKPPAKDVGSVKVSLIEPSSAAVTSTSRLQFLSALSATWMWTFSFGIQLAPARVTVSPGAYVALLLAKVGAGGASSAGAAAGISPNS